ncbi:hypothetical protein LINGRAHAP2_LOCUS4370 [Linum grandiflorum]
MSSPSANGDRDAPHVKKKVRAMDLNQDQGMDEVILEDITNSEETSKSDPVPPPNAWTQRSNRLFENFRYDDEWYIADSDSEDVAEAMREEDDVFDEETYDPLCPSVLFTAAEKVSFRRILRSALVVKSLGRRVPYAALAPRLNYLWAKEGPIKISDLQNGCYLVRFKCKHDYDGAVTGGPWLLGETYLTVHQWHKGFNPWTAEVKTTMAWVQLPDLPIEYYNPVAVKRIASYIGKPVRVDRATEVGARGKFARVCVEVDLTKPLLSKYMLEGVKYLISYEGLPNLCTECGRYGSPTHLCKCRAPPEDTPMVVETENDCDGANLTEEAVYGKWMNATRKKKWSHRNNYHNNPSRSESEQHVSSKDLPSKVGNRFDILQEEMIDSDLKNSDSYLDTGVAAKTMIVGNSGIAAKTVVVGNSATMGVEGGSHGGDSLAETTSSPMAISVPLKSGIGKHTTAEVSKSGEPKQNDTTWKISNIRAEKPKAASSLSGAVKGLSQSAFTANTRVSGRAMISQIQTYGAGNRSPSRIR